MQEMNKAREIVQGIKNMSDETYRLFLLELKNQDNMNDEAFETMKIKFDEMFRQ